MYGINEDDYRRDLVGVVAWERKNVIRKILEGKTWKELDQMHNKMFKDLDPSLPAWHINKVRVERANKLQAIFQMDRAMSVDQSDESEEVSLKNSKKAAMAAQVSATKLSQSQPKKLEKDRKALTEAEMKARYRARKKGFATMEDWEKHKEKKKLEKKELKNIRSAQALAKKRAEAKALKKATGAHTIGQEEQ